MDRPSKEILIKYFKGECQFDEQELVELYLAMNTDAAYIEECMREAWPQMQSDDDIPVEDADLKAFKTRFHRLKDMDNNEAGLPAEHARVVKLPGWLKVAVAVLVLAGALMLFRNTHRQPAEQLVKSKTGEPGRNNALLKLANGTIVKLSDVAVGEKFALQNGVEVEKTAEGDIKYNTDDKEALADVAYNTVVTPNGGQYRVTLPDGSKAWLNAGSSLHYPLHFAAGERRVKMTGEVYFEIAKQYLPVQAGQYKRVPFYVETEKQEIQVLGTHFNVNAYPEEVYTVTTLSEGSIRIKVTNGKSVLLLPGQQALVNNNITIQQVDTAAYTAWTNGDFVFKGETLQSVLHKVSRWYDVEIDCPSEIEKMRFSGIVSRSQPLSAIIEMLEATNKVKVILKERRLIVRN